MFARIGSFAVRFRWFIIAAWIVAAGAGSVLQSDADRVVGCFHPCVLPEAAEGDVGLDAVGAFGTQPVAGDRATPQLGRAAGAGELQL